MQVVEEVIRGRQVCAEWYASQTVKEDSDLRRQNDAHNHFIGVLKEVHHILAAAVKPSGKPQPQASDNLKEAHLDTLNNLFAHLDVEEPSETPLGSAPSVVPDKPAAKTTHKGPQKTTYELLEDEGDSLAFELWCILQDMSDVRDFLRQTWTEYSKGKVSLLAAGVVTDTAFGLLRRASEEFTARQPQFWDMWQVLNYLSLIMYMSGSLIMIFPGEKGSPRNPSPDVNPAALLCPTALMMLRVFTDQIKMYRAHQGAWQDVLSQDTLTNKLFPLYTQHVFGPTLLSLIPKVVTYAAQTRKDRQRGKDCGFGDEFVKGLVDACDKQEVPIWLVVACQAYLDIYDILGRDTACGIDALIDGHHKVAKSVDQFRVFSQTFSDRCLKPLWDNSFQAVTRDSVAFAKILYNAKTTEAFAVGSAAALHRGTPVEISSQLPVMPCSLLYGLKAHLHSTGVLAAHDGVVVLALAHLYRAGRMHGVITADWEDMEFVIAKQSAKEAYVMQQNTDADAQALLRHYSMALGQPVTKVVRSSNPGLPSLEIVVKNARKLSVTSEFIKGVVEQTKSHGPSSASCGRPVDIALRILKQEGGSPSTPAKPASKVMADSAGDTATPRSDTLRHSVSRNLRTASSQKNPCSISITLRSSSCVRSSCKTSRQTFVPSCWQQHRRTVSKGTSWCITFCKNVPMLSLVDSRCPTLCSSKPLLACRTTLRSRATSSRQMLTGSPVVIFHRSHAQS